MNYKQAMEILEEANKPDGVYRLEDFLHAKHFIEGYESRDAEVAELKNFVTYCMKYSNDGHVVKMAKKLEESK